MTAGSPISVIDFAACRRVCPAAGARALLAAPRPAAKALHMGQPVRIAATGLEGRIAAYDGARVIVRLPDGTHPLVPLAGVEPVAPAARPGERRSPGA